MKRVKSGFTIVEMLVVVAVIAILAGAITVGVNGMFYKSRLGRAKAMSALLQSALETYYARCNDWPGALKGLSEGTGANEDSILLSDEQADKCFAEVVRISVGPNAKPVLDPSGLFVAKGANKGCTDIHRAWDAAVKYGVVGSGSWKCNGRCMRGRDFTEATKRGRSDRITLDSMNFGYQGPNHGRFCRFRLYYYPKSDTVRVLLQPANQYSYGKYPNGFIDD